MKTDQSTRNASKIFSPQTIEFRQFVYDMGYAWESMSSKDKQELANRLSGMIEPNPAWTGLYVHNVYQGMSPSKNFMRAWRSLAAAFDGIPLDVAAAYQVQAVSVHPVHRGVLILQEERQCAYPPCGLWFIPRAGNQLCHSENCARKRRRLREKEKHGKV